MAQHPIVDALASSLTKAQRRVLAAKLLPGTPCTHHAIDGVPVPFWPQTELAAADDAMADDVPIDMANKRAGFHRYGKTAVIAILGPNSNKRPGYVFELSDAAVTALFERCAGGMPRERGKTRGKAIEAIKGMVLGENPSALSRRHRIGKPDVWAGQYDQIARLLETQNWGAAQTRLAVEWTTILNEIADDHAATGRPAVSEYARRYLPGGTRTILSLDDPNDPNAPPIPVFAFGPPHGDPLIVLHAMVLQPLTPADLRLFEDLGIRAYFPLRHGKLDRWATPMDHDAHVRHALRGIDAVAREIGDRPFHLAGLISSSRIALDYARKNFRRLSGLTFVAAVAGGHSRGVGGPRTLGLAVQDHLAKGAANVLQWLPLARFAEDHLFDELSFESFIHKHFARTGGTDAAIIAAEMRDEEARQDSVMGRFRYAFLNSPESVRHDFMERKSPDWTVLHGTDLRVGFIHGARDEVHKLKDIEALIETIPKATLTVIPDAGQLLYERHTHSVLSNIAERMQEA